MLVTFSIIKYIKSASLFLTKDILGIYNTQKEKKVYKKLIFRHLKNVLSYTKLNIMHFL